MQQQKSQTLDRINEILKPGDKSAVDTIIRPLQRFINAEEAGGVALIVCTAIALAIANSPWAAHYHAFWETHVVVGVGRWSLDYSLLHWVNDGLMAVFFFYVGLEIKREMLIGELSSVRNAALPIAAAFGGMLIPALIYVAFNGDLPAARGWGIPMATDIAFALGVLALLGRRIPFGLTVFLAALAIADDLGAVLVIALFYSSDIVVTNLAIAASLLAFLTVLGRMGVRRPAVYLFVGVLVWLAVLKSGVHATIAGVMLALTVPTRTAINSAQFLRQSRRLTDEFERLGVSDHDILGVDDQEAVVQAMESSCERVQAPSQRIQRNLSRWVSFAIMPVFALANAGIALQSDVVAALAAPVTIGVAVGLFAGKQIGIALFAWLAVRFGIGALPAGATWRHVYGIALLGGIGFTMSMFIASLAFVDVALLNDSKVGILVGSLLSAVAGYVVLRATPVATHE